MSLISGAKYLYIMPAFVQKYHKNNTKPIANMPQKKLPINLYIDKQLLKAMEDNYNELVEYDGITKFKAFIGSKSQFFTYILSLGLKEYVKLRAEELAEEELNDNPQNNA